MARLSKSRIVAFRQCPKRLWLQINRPDLLETSASADARMEAGTNLGEVARSMYSPGVLIDGNDLSLAIKATQEAIKVRIGPIFEATFQYQGVLVRADLLLPDAGSYRMAEVKSSTGVKDHHLVDAAIQTWVVRGAGLNVSHVEIAHVDTSFVYCGGNDYQGLLHHADITQQIQPLVQQVPQWVAAARDTLAGYEPRLSTGEQCHAPFECPFIGYCGPQPANGDLTKDRFPVNILPYGGALVASLQAEGFEDLRDVPETRLSKPLHLRVWRATKHDTPELAPLAGEHVRALGYPRYYIDFETLQPVVPTWAGTSPYDQVPFQWSCHVESAKGGMSHAAFLADGIGDPRRPFAESLIAVVGQAGAVIVYNAAFERTRLRELAVSLPDLAPALNAIVERMFDLLPVARQNYYHTDMRGSWSIKAVLPTIAPELAYDGLEVGNGGMAQEAFAEILHADTPPQRREQLRNALLVYCQRDTLAMVKIAHYFESRTGT